MFNPNLSVFRFQISQKYFLEFDQAHVDTIGRPRSLPRNQTKSLRAHANRSPPNSSKQVPKTILKSRRGKRNYMASKQNIWGPRTDHTKQSADNEHSWFRPIRDVFTVAFVFFVKNAPIGLPSDISIYGQDTLVNTIPPLDWSKCKYIS